MATQLYFRYSPIYDRTLASQVGVLLSKDAVTEGWRFATEFGTHWKKINDKVFAFYAARGLTLADFWLAYPVHRQQGIIPFNDPLTFFIDQDLDHAASVVLHELCHTFFGYFANNTTAEKLWNPIAHQFSGEELAVQEHILVNILAGAGYIHIFGMEAAGKLIEVERSLPSLQRSWACIFEKISGDISKLAEFSPVMNSNFK